MRLAWITAALITLAVGARTHAQHGTSDELSDEEMQQILDSLGADEEGEQQSSETADSIVTGAQSAARLLDLEIAVILDVAFAWFSDDEADQLGAHDPSATGFNLQQLEMSLSGAVDPFFRFDANLVFAEFGVELEEAYATTMALPGNLQVRAGQFLTRFGRLNPTHPHSWSFLDQPLVNGKFLGGEGSRGLGLELSYLAHLPWYAEFFVSANDASGECCARSFQVSEVDGPEDLLYTTALKQFFPFGSDWSLMWGLSAQFGANESGRDTRTEIYGTDLYLRFRPVASTNRAAFSWQTEAMYRTRQIPGDALADLGLYSQMIWNVNAEWELGCRYDYVQGITDDPLDPDWSDDRQRASLAVSFYPSHFSRLRLQASRDDPQAAADAVYAAMLGLEILVGAHGAHSF